MQKNHLILSFILFCSIAFNSYVVSADELWYSYSISTINNDRLKQVHAIFSDLLRANSNVVKGSKPKLYVVYTRQGPWSASLPDGSVLLSEQAVRHAFKGNSRSARNKIAFVMAQELSLLQDREFWHRQYFSIIGASEQAVDELQVESINSLEDFKQTSNIEKKSHHNALMMMSTLGYDYIDIAKDKKYFNRWLSASWGQVCKDLRNVSNKACSIDKKFIQTWRSNFFNAVTTQLVYDTAFQAYVGGNIQLARLYLKEYLTEFVHPKAHLLTGLSHLSKAITNRRKFVDLDGYHKNVYIYPAMYDADPELNQMYQPIMGLDSKTGNEFNIEKKALGYKKQISNSIELAIKSFEKVIEMDPKHKIAYANITAAYLTINNLPKANKFLFSKYVNRFGSDSVSNLYSGVLHASFRRDRKAKIEFSRLTKNKNPVLATLGFANLAEVYRAENKTRHAVQVWKKLKEFSAKTSDVVVKALTNPIEYRKDKPEFSVNSRLAIAKIIPGDRISVKSLKSKSVLRFPIKISGKKLSFYHTRDGANVLLSAEGFVHAAWQDRKLRRSNKYRWLNKSEKQLFKKLGAPSKLVPTLKGRILVYSDLNLAFKTVAGKIDQWFYFPKTD